MYVYIDASKIKKIKRGAVYITNFTNMKDMSGENKNDIDMPEVSNNFYAKYNSQIRAIVTRILKNANQTQDINDCVNAVFLDLMEKLQQYNDTRGSMAAFVAIITRSAALNYCKSNSRKTSELIGDDNIDFLCEPMQFESDVEFDMLVKNILAKLNEKESVLFTMRFILVYSPEEIAKALKIKRNAVDIRVNRLKKKIKNFLTQGGMII